MEAGRVAPCGLLVVAGVTGWCATGSCEIGVPARRRLRRFVGYRREEGWFVGRQREDGEVRGRVGWSCRCGRIGLRAQRGGEGRRAGKVQRREGGKDREGRSVVGVHARERTVSQCAVEKG